MVSSRRKYRDCPISLSDDHFELGVVGDIFQPNITERTIHCATKQCHLVIVPEDYSSILKRNYNFSCRISIDVSGVTSKNWTLQINVPHWFTPTGNDENLFPNASDKRILPFSFYIRNSNASDLTTPSSRSPKGPSSVVNPQSIPIVE